MANGVLLFEGKKANDTPMGVNHKYIATLQTQICGLTLLIIGRPCLWLSRYPFSYQ